ncbi:Spermine/spermidine synthase [Amycolatopsis arida]|uniref:Spermine/spermidine synthase n=1 Tax=Amycolatopsis arida TaxID=587909 RepID=A0A1I5ZCE9_9PSEU|nr:spermidine synthase [Amycolatopsis arida]TDX89511.1 spermine/spermidine synthase [Amycolatopsis arida]SFQ54048.1 Spermine/spermidine synthase [Amycolatopsis arida]
MSARFEEIDWRPTPMGELVLRRRREPVTGQDVYEIKLDDEFLMSSLFTVSEQELARLALAELAEPELDVVVGGLGLGYTARTVLEHPRVRSLLVVDALAEVIEWHERGAIPAGERLVADPRCTLVHGDFFAMVRSPEGLAPAATRRRFHAVIVDIDHSPRHLLHPGHAGFYRPQGLRQVRAHLHPGGVFALWSNDPPDDDFLAMLGGEFAAARAEVVTFDNPVQRRTSACTVYLAVAGPEPAGR